ncbi:MAG: AMP-binding protein, partial [Klenkia sp.]|nr:AMP-binding protein [Klenkia sp.]
MSTAQDGPTLASVAFAALRRRSDEVAFSWDGGEATGAAVLVLVGRYQHVYARHGLQRGERLALLSSNRVEAWCAGLAAQASGLAITWLQGLASSADHLYQLQDAQVSAVVVDHVDHAARGIELAASTELPEGLTVFATGAADFGVDLAAEADRAGASTVQDLSRPDDAALLNYTGGTTGRPKGALRSNRAAAVMHASSGLAGFEFPQAPRHLAVAPYTHVGGTKLLPALLRGGSVHLMTKFDPDQV